MADPAEVPLQDAGGPLLPIDGEPLTPEEQIDLLDERLDQADTVVVAEDAPPPIGKSWAFDFTSGFVPAPAGGPLEEQGLAAIRTLVEKAIRTARGAHPIYSDDYGIDFPYEVIGKQANAPEIVLLRQAIEEAALSAHPRVNAVTNYAAVVEPEEEALFVSFDVVLDSGESVSLTSVRITPPGSTI